MTWSDFYAVCFLVGFLLSAVSLLMTHSQAHLPHHADGLQGHGGHGHGGNGPHAGHGAEGAHAHVEHAGRAGQSFSPFNFATGSAFLAWFGGTGFLLTRYSAVWVGWAVGLSTLTGLAGASLVFWFVVNVLMKHEKDLNPADYDPIGVLGRLSAPILERGGTGEIIFSQEGARRILCARSENGSAIPKDTEVVVTRYERGIAYVRRWDELVS
ncbi:MAG: NfeD family protein [Bryobacteraceae bacterium]